MFFESFPPTHTMFGGDLWLVVSDPPKIRNRATYFFDSANFFVSFSVFLSKKIVNRTRYGNRTGLFEKLLAFFLLAGRARTPQIHRN
jgi:hypothetical protein